jgi:hypothetical protein
MKSDRLELARLAVGGLNRRERAELLRTFTPAATEPATERQTTTPRLLRRAEVANRLGRSPRAVDMLGAQGILRRVRLPGRTRAAGFLESEIAALLEART